MSQWSYFIRGYYGDSVKPPKQPGELAIEVGGKSREALEMDRSVLEGREDIGDIEILGPFYPPVSRPGRVV